MRILIVEDDDRVAGALEAFLARSGYATVRAADGAAALDLLVRTPRSSCSISGFPTSTVSTCAAASVAARRFRS